MASTQYAVVVIPVTVASSTVTAAPDFTVTLDPSVNETPVAWKISMPVLAEILTLSNTTVAIFSSGRPHRIPALVEPVTVTFLIVMFFQIGVVAVMAIAVSAVGWVGSVG